MNAGLESDTSRNGKYRLLAELGEGGMARVYLALAQGPSGFNKLVVIKALKSGLAIDPEFRTMFLAEARLAARLNHPNVVQTYEIDEEFGAPVIVMEYLEGQPLSRVFARGRQRGRFPLPIFLRVLVDALAGLHYAHELEDYDGAKLQLVHRDISPHNIFVTFDGQVKILDFGIAKSVGMQSETQTGVIKGKVRYVSRERVLGEEADRRADVFAMGAILWEVASGQPLWMGETDVQIMHRLTTGEIPSPRTLNPDVTTSLEQICMKALAWKADDRYRTAAEFETDLEDELKRMGEAVRPRDVGGFVAELFADRRAETKALIEEQISKATTLSSGDLDRLGAVLLPADPSAPTIKAEAPAGVTTPNLVIAPRVEENARSRRVLVLAIAAVILSTVFAIRLFSTGDARPADATDASPQTASAASIAVSSSSVADAAPSSAVALDIDLSLAATPPNAVLFVDDARLPSNPFVEKASPDPNTHKLRAEAPGYVPRTVEFSKAKSIAIVLTLERMAPAKGAGPVRAGGAVGTATVASATATAVKPACAVPYFIDDQGIKRFKPECM